MKSLKSPFIVIFVVCFIIFLFELLTIGFGFGFGIFINQFLPCRQLEYVTMPCYLGIDFYLILASVVIGILSILGWLIQQTVIYYRNK